MKCTPTKVRTILIYRDEEEMSWSKILTQPLFAETSISKNTIKKHYCDAKAHGNDCYWTGKKGKPGVKYVLPESGDVGVMQRSSG